VNILSKAIEKATPKFEAQRPLARPETAKSHPLIFLTMIEASQLARKIITNLKPRQSPKLT